MVVGLPSAEKYTPGPDRRGAFRLSTLEIANPTEQFSFRFRLRPSTFLFLFLSSSISSTPAVRPLLLLHPHRPFFSISCLLYYTPPVAQTVQYHRPCQCIPGMAPRPMPPPPLLDLASTPPPPLLNPPYKCLGYDGSRL